MFNQRDNSKRPEDFSNALAALLSGLNRMGQMAKQAGTSIKETLGHVGKHGASKRGVSHKVGKSFKSREGFVTPAEYRHMHMGKKK
jgi:hypothetical protein